MINRRRFLGYSLTGMATAIVGCRPSDFDQTSNQHTSRGSSHPLLLDKNQLASRKEYFLGYPLNINTPSDDFFSWRKALRKVGIGDFGFNNVGNPYAYSAITFNTHDLEKEVVSRFGKIYGFSPDNTWGFISHSGTDSNMHGMYIGRMILQRKTKEIPKCYFTREAHYSIQILGDLLGMERVFVKTHPNAGMDANDLRAQLSQNPNNPALVVATIGTTFKGAIDNIDEIQKALKNHESYLHLDAALFGGYLPHTTGAAMVSCTSKDKKRSKRFDSIAVSCHKFFGFPSPAGLFITTQDRFNQFHEQYSMVHNPEYIGHVPGTITCSRDAVKPAEFHYFSTPKALSRQAEDAQQILKNTNYLEDQMQSHLPDLQAMRTNELSNTIYFINPGNRIVKKYSLATMHLDHGMEKRDYAHVVVMPHASQKVLDEFLNDLGGEYRSIGL